MEIYLVCIIIGVFIGAYLWKPGFRIGVHGAIGKLLDWLTNKEEKKHGK